MTGDPITAALASSPPTANRSPSLDDREADHHAALSERLAEIADLVTGSGEW